MWRQEVSRRVQAHRARRRKPEASLPLDFDGSGEAAVAGRGWREEPAKSSSPPAQRARRHLRGARALTEEPAARVIEFPKASASPELQPGVTCRGEKRTEEELAEPLLDFETPRILEAPEAPEIMTPPAMAQIRLDAPAESPPRACEIELPLRVAPLAARIYAALVDSLLVSSATACFGMIVVTMLKELPQSRLAVLCAFAVPGLLWMIYQYLFLVYGKQTLGMQMAGLELTTFDSRPAARRQRLGRLLATMLAAVSCGMGFVWALLDEDRLGWHDRISRTYLQES